jgi:RNA polymerase sigma-70 factor (ECF subfamily)
LATAGEAFFHEHFDRLYAYVRMRVGARACEDIVGDVFVLAIERQEQLRGDPAAWLFAIARNRVADHFRNAFQEKEAGMIADTTGFEFAAIAEAPNARSMLPLDALEADEFRALLQRQLETLTDLERDVIAFKFTDGLANTDIAELLGLSRTNLGVILHRALKRLRDAMMDELSDA